MRLSTSLGRFVKRGIDFVSSGVGLTLLFPLFVLIAAWIKLDSSGPVFFRQARVGRGGDAFRIWKFRTMVEGGRRLGPGVTSGGDPRVTRAGRFLRARKLDELPQLINVLRGEMSLVGPRPELPEYVEMYAPSQRRVLEVRPGITDPASLAYRDEEKVLAAVVDPEMHYATVVMPHKISINLEYQTRATVLSDLGLILKTLFALFR